MNYLDQNAIESLKCNTFHCIALYQIMPKCICSIVGSIDHKSTTVSHSRPFTMPYSFSIAILLLILNLCSVNVLICLLALQLSFSRTNLFTMQTQSLIILNRDYNSTLAAYINVAYGLIYCIYYCFYLLFYAFTFDGN